MFKIDIYMYPIYLLPFFLFGILSNKTIFVYIYAIHVSILIMYMYVCIYNSKPMNGTRVLVTFAVWLFLTYSTYPR